MSWLNWDRARRQALVTRAVDYSGRMDAGEAMLSGTADQAPQQTRKRTVLKAQIRGCVGTLPRQGLRSPN